MFTVLRRNRQWSDVGLRVLIVSIIAVFLLAIADGVFKGTVDYTNRIGFGRMIMISTWVTDFRYIFEQAVYAATIFFVGAKFFETRTMLTIGFDKLDAAKIAVNGPDENNTIWIGHRYKTRIEAESIAEAFRERLKESA